MKLFYALIPLLLLTHPVKSQTTYSLNSSESQVLVKGTSTVHDWESNAEKFTVSLTVAESDEPLLNVQALSFEVEAGSIKSGKRIMDGKTRDALKSKKHPKITFVFSEISDLTKDSITVKGDLTIAGVTKPAEITAGYTFSGNTLTITGSHQLLMSNFGIKPPTAMMGSLKTGDEVTVEFDLNLTAN